MSEPRVLSMKQYLAAGGDALFSGFACPLNQEVDDFLKIKAVQSNNLKASVSYLVVDPVTAELLGYFTLVLKPFTVHESKLSKSNIRLISRFAERNDETQTFTASVYLIAQIGKNYAVEANRRISGKDLLDLAFDKLRAAQDLVGGKMVMVEREADREKLHDFYAANGFKSWNARFDKRDNVQYDQMIRALESVA